MAQYTYTGRAAGGLPAWLLLLLVPGTAFLSGLPITGMKMKNFPIGLYLEACNSGTGFRALPSSRDSSDEVHVSLALRPHECDWDPVWPSVKLLKTRGPFDFGLQIEPFDDSFPFLGKKLNLKFPDLFQGDNPLLKGNRVRGMTYRTDNIGVSYVKQNEKAEEVVEKSGIVGPFGEIPGSHNGIFICIWDEGLREKLVNYRRSTQVPVCGEAYHTSKLETVFPEPQSFWVSMFAEERDKSLAYYLRDRSKRTVQMDDFKADVNKRKQIAESLKAYLDLNHPLLLVASNGTQVFFITQSMCHDEHELESLKEFGADAEELKRGCRLNFRKNGEVYRKKDDTLAVNPLKDGTKGMVPFCADPPHSGIPSCPKEVPRTSNIKRKAIRSGRLPSTLTA